MHKESYYIYVPNGQISRDSEYSQWNFKIDATDNEIIRLRELFDEILNDDSRSFFRAHVPYVQYHYDRENDEYDEKLKQIYGIIYELGNPEAKEHIQQMGILESNVKDGLSD
ncbi:hydrolase [Peribacillus sp. SCS-155]|uniref:hydrolase n=1 Tax=Peribacillus sedimenti TaxID=3115297 RepID=UPI003905D866